MDGFTLMLLAANFANTKLCKKSQKLLDPWQIGTHLRVLSENYPMNTNMTGFRCFQRFWHPCGLDKSSLSIGRVRNACISEGRDFSQDFHNRVSKLGFQEFTVSIIPD